VQTVNAATVGQPDKFGVKATRNLLESYHERIQQMIPNGVQLTAERLINNAILQMELSRDRKVLLCTPVSILYSVMAAASVGLDLMGDQAYLVAMSKKNPRSGEHEYYYATLWPDYKGLCTVAARSGWYLDSQIVREKDQFAIDVGTNQIQHQVGFGERGELIGVYCAVRQMTTGKIFHIETMNRQEIDAMKKETDPWLLHYEKMAKKCTAKAAFNWVPRDRYDIRVMGTIEKRIDEGRELDRQMLGQRVENG